MTTKGTARGVLAVLCAVLVVVLPLAAVRAGMITSFAIPTPTPNNDDAPGPNANAIELVGFVSSLEPADLTFTVVPSGGTTEYLVSVGANNDTGVAWRGFRFELGFGVGAGFVPAAGVLPGLDFDTPSREPAPTGGAFGVLDHQPTALAWSGGSVPPIFDNTFALSIDVPDLPGLVPALGLGPEGYEFTLRQVPAVGRVPGPAPLLLLGVGLLGCAGLGWRQRLRRTPPAR